MSSEMKQRERGRLRADGGEFDPAGPPEAPPPDETEPFDPLAPAPVAPMPAPATKPDDGALRAAFGYLVDEEDPPKPPKK